MQLYFNENIEVELALSAEDSRHCIKVLRNKVGDTIWVTNGKGKGYLCEIVNDSPKRCTLKVLEEKQQEQSKRKIHLAIAATKNSDRIEHLVEKCTEIGISEISLLRCQNSERNFQKLERLNKKAISAMKQSLQFYLPLINEQLKVNDFIEQVKEEQLFIAHLNESSVAFNTCKLEENLCILIGPEGDFTKEEIEMAKAKGFKMVQLGKTRLRTETAGLLAVALANFI